MAKVQLSDLMNPLTKIERSTQETSQKLDDLIAVVTGNSTVGDSLNEAILAQLTAQTEILRNIARGSSSGLMSLFKGSGSEGDGSGLKAGGEALKVLGAGSSEMAKALLLFTFVPKKTIVKFESFIVKIFTALTTFDEKKIEAGAENLMLMGDGIMNFAKSLALSAVLLIPGMIALPFLTASILGISTVMWLIGTQEKRITKGAKALDRTGDALVSFGIGMAVFAVTTMFILMKPQILLGMVASLALVGATVGVLGLASRTIKKGAGALALMGVGLAAFSIGYGIFALVTSFVEPANVLTQALVIGGIGLVVGLVGLGFSQVALGAIALGLVGIGLGVFSIGYGIFTAVSRDITAEDALAQAAIIGGIGGAFALVGIPPIAAAIVLGAIAMGLAGLSLLPLSLGLMAFKATGWKEQESKELATALGTIRVAFTGGSAEGGFLAKLGGAFTGMLDSGVMIASAASYGAAGLALISLSAGLTKFQAVGWKEEDSKLLGVTLGTISAAFAQAGGSPSNPGGIFGQVFGTMFSPNAVERGIDSVMDAGEALSEISTGLVSFNNFANSGVNFGDPNNPLPGTLAYNVINTVGFISKAFAAVANEGNVEGGGFFGSLFNIRRNKVEEGIRSVKGVGDELKGIADGLLVFQDFVEKDVNFDVLGATVSKVIGFVGSAFAKIGGETEEDAGSALFGLIKWDQNKVEAGIDAVKGAGEELSNIANGLLTFSQIEDPTKTAMTIRMLLESMSGTFTVFYDKPNFSSRVDNFSGFITSLAGVAEDGSLMKAADGMEAMAEAINSVDIDKATAFANLFEASAALSERGRNLAALEALVEAIEDVQETLTEQGDAAANGAFEGIKSALGFGSAPEAKTDKSDASLNSALKNLQVTLNQINATLAELPGDIAEIEIKLPRD